jgi:1-acyl-sn-glycerol-3-phosphate acyltransferase
MGFFFISINRYFQKRKWLVVSLAIALIALIFYSVSNLETDEDFSALFPKEKNLEKFNLVLEKSSLADKIVVFFSVTDTATDNKTRLLIDRADLFVDSIQRKFDTQIKDIKYKVSDSDILSMYDFFYDNLPFFLTDEDYREIDKRISDSSLSPTLQNDLKILVSPAGIAMKHFLLKDPFGITGLALNKINQFQVGENFSIVENRIFSKDENDLFVFITVHNSTDTREMKQLVTGINRLAASDGNSPVSVNYFGAPIVAAANAERIKKDILLTVSITLLFIFIFLSLYFRNYFLPIFLFIPVIVGGGISLIMVYFLKGEISAISMGVGSVLLGIGIDYSIHFFTHSKQVKSVNELLKDVSVPIMMSSITTASAFLCLFVIKSTVFQDLGLFAALSVLSTAIASLVILPLVFRSLKKWKQGTPKIVFPEKIAFTSFEKNKYVIIVVIVLSIVFYFTGKKTSFNENLMDVNYMPDELAEAEAFLNDKTGFAKMSVYLVASGNSFEDALNNSVKVSSQLDSLKNRGIIKEYFSVNSIIVPPDVQKQKIRKWNSYWQNKKENLIESIIEKGEAIKFKPDAFSGFFELLDREYKPVPLERFNELKNLFLSDYLIESEEKSAVITLIKAGREQKEILGKSIKETETVFLFDNQKLTEGLFSVVKSQFHVLILLSSLIVFAILLLSFGRIELAVISFVPIVLSWVWTVGIMGLFNIQFNIFNIIISSFIFGLGVDYSIFITKGLLHKLQFNKNNIHTFKTSILLSGITTIFGTGVLIFAQHPALKSIALVSVIGISSAILISFTVQPFLFNFLTRTKGKKRALPITLYNLVFSVSSLLYFLLSTLSLALIIIPVLKIVPKKPKKKKLFVHRLIKFFSKTVVYHNVHVRKVLVNFDKDTFKEPILAISNHQSVLDLVFLLMLHHKIVILANKRAFTNPFFGPAIRFTEFIYVDEGLDEIAEIVKQRMEEGYSVLIFPEGTRSANCKIQRFHKGAFYIAEKLKLQIMPILLHGSGEALSKNEFFLRRGIVHIKAYDKIDFKGGAWGKSYRWHSKAMQKFYRKELEKQNLETWVPDRLKHNLINRYIYRGPVLEWYLRVKLRLENNYNLINNIVPRNAVITDIGCGYGFLATMLVLVSDERKVLGIDYDEDKITTAKYCTEDLGNLEFIHDNALTATLPKSDVVILSDVLHYLTKEKQLILLGKSFSALNEDGIVIVRDADADLKKRTFGTRLTEFFSTRFGFNKTEGELDFTSGKQIIDIAKKNGLRTEKIDDTKYTSNITYILRK